MRVLFDTLDRLSSDETAFRRTTLLRAALREIVRSEATPESVIAKLR